MSAVVPLDLELQIGVAKVSKYAVSESGDTLEMIERPHGGLSLVLADGQRSGKPAKRVSNLVVRKAISLLAEGVRDGAAARAAHDYLHTHYEAKVSATLNIVSVDLVTRTIVISRNSHCPAYVWSRGQMRVLNEPSQPIGIYPRTRPVITELEIVAPTYAVVFTDGVLDAGSREGKSLDVAALIGEFAPSGGAAQALADEILRRCLELDRGRPADDTSVLVLAVLPRTSTDEARRMTVRFPM